MSRQKFPGRCLSTVWFAREAEDQSSGKLAVHHHLVGNFRPTNQANGLLFSGDTYYPGPIWLFRPETDLVAYRNSVQRLAALQPQVRLVLAAHNVPVGPPEVLGELAAAFDKVQARTGALQARR